MCAPERGHSCPRPSRARGQECPPPFLGFLAGHKRPSDGLGVGEDPGLDGFVFSGCGHGLEGFNFEQSSILTAIMELQYDLVGTWAEIIWIITRWKLLFNSTEDVLNPMFGTCASNDAQ